MSPEDPRHGSVAGYHAHRRDKETACDVCKKAIAGYEARRAYERANGATRQLDARGVRRRIQALMALGWTARHIAEAAGLPCPESVYRMRDTTFTHRDTFRRVARAYAALSGRPGPSNITRGRAIAAGYAPPLAWDDIDRDKAPRGASRKVAKVKPARQTFDSPDHRACARCGIVREMRPGVTHCLDCRPHVVVSPGTVSLPHETMGADNKTAPGGALTPLIQGPCRLVKESTDA